MQKKSSRKAKKPTPEYDSQREQNVLMEEIYSAVKKVAEKVSTVKEEILTEVMPELGGVKSELETVKMAVMENSANLKAIKFKLDTTISNHDKRITRLEDKVSV